MSKPCAALFGGQMSSQSLAPIHIHYVDYCKSHFSIDLLSLDNTQSIAHDHLKLTAQALTQFSKFATSTQFSTFLGYSVGQFAALCACEAIEYQNAFDLVHKRAQLLESARNNTQTLLINVLGVPVEKISHIIEGYGSEAYIGAYNSKMNTMIGFKKSIRDQLLLKIHELLPIKIIEPTSFGAWHTPFMTSAANDFEIYIDKYLVFKPVDRLFIENTQGKILNLSEINRSDLIDNLVTSIYKPVEFLKMITQLQTLEINVGYEFGSEPFLSKLVPFINRNFKIIYPMNTI